MKTLSPTQQACLEAMGIDVWVSRESNSFEATATSTSEVISKPNSDPGNEPVANVVSVEKHADVVTTDKLNIPADWNNLRQAVSTCQACTLHASRTQSVFGSGNEKADWLIIGDAPSNDDDLSGQIFSGQQGELLTAMLRAIGLTRQQVYLANIVKCMPADKRDVEPNEAETCLQYLKQQITLLQPKLILVLGQHAAQSLLNSHSTLARLRQKVQALDSFNIPVVVTYHPASLLSMPSNKRDAWQDLLFAQKIISTANVL